jgi:hydroxymethylglutaryl-CoA lyase
MTLANDKVTIVDVGPRDGLQNEPGEVAATIKVELITRLAECGLRVIEAGSFVSPRWVPQMADSEQVLAAVATNLGGRSVRLPVLVPNLKGLERARAAGAAEVAVFTAASESFSQRNTNCSIAESMSRLEAVIAAAREAGMDVRGYISCVLGCPYEGSVDAAAVVDLAERLTAAGCFEVSLGDTIGTGTPAAARTLVETVARSIPARQLALHFHDTYGQALANLLACLETGVRTVDASVAGLGGCPYARGASGNVATEDVVYMLHGLGLDTGIDLAALARTGGWISDQLGRHNNSRAGAALNAKQDKPG